MRNFLRTVAILLLFNSIAVAQYKHQWTKTVGGIWSEISFDATIDKDENLFIIGYADSDFDLNPDPIVVSVVDTIMPSGLQQPNNAFIAKYDSSGNYLWHRRSVFSHPNLITSAKCDLSGNVYIAGYFSETAYIDDGFGGFDTLVSSNGGNDINFVLCKYSANGVLLYANKIEAYVSTLRDLTIDSFNNVYITGEFSQWIDFDPGQGAIADSSGNSTPFFAKYDSIGNYLFSKVFDFQMLTTSLVFWKIAIDRSDNIVLDGDLQGSYNFGSGNLPAGNFIAKYDGQGNFIFSKSVGEVFFGYSLFIDDDNSIYMAGIIENSADIDPGPGVYMLQSKGYWDAVIAKYDSLGNLEFGRAFGDSGQWTGEFACGIVADSNKNIYVYGWFAERIQQDNSFGMPYFEANGISEMYLLKLDSSGYTISINKTESSSSIGTPLSRIFLLNDKTLYLTGLFSANADFDFSSGIFTRTSNGYNDIFLSKYLLKDEHFLISGKVYSDLNNDSIFNTGDAPLQNVIVQVTPGNYFASTNAAGDYYCYVPQGNYTITIPTPPVHYTVSFPLSDTAVFMPLSSQVDTANHFALRPEPNAQDLKISMTNLGPMRPGFVGAYVTSAANVGTVALPATATFDYDNDLIYYSAAPVADTILPYHLAWNVDTLFPSQSTNLLSEFIVAANLGDTVTTECRIYSDSADLTPTNNKDKLNLIAQGSWDPNYKEVFPQGALLASQADTTLLTYTIHFQNTGTDTAFTVLLVDTLSDLLNVSTLVVEAMSHACTYVISGNGIIEFTFRNIFLPDSGTNFIGSCGFVKYSIKPHVGLNNGMTIENTAHIVFDFNVPVITNTTQTPIGVLGVDENNSLHNSFFLFPNPTSSSITLSNFNPAHSYSISIKNILGNTIISQTTKGKERASINVAILPSGIYFVTVESDGKVETKKFVKL